MLEELKYIKDNAVKSYGEDGNKATIYLSELDWLIEQVENVTQKRVINVNKETLKEQIRKLPRYTTNNAAVLYPDQKGEFIEIGSALSLINAITEHK